MESSALLSSAVAWQLTIIGEAVKRLSERLRADHPAVPWAAMARMRDRVAHGYDTIDWSIVWRVVRDELPPVLSQVDEILTARKVRLPGK